MQPHKFRLAFADGSVDAGDFAHLLAIPFTHVAQMARHHVVLLGHLALDCLQLLGLLGQFLTDDGNLLRPLLDLGLTPVEPRFGMQESLAHLREMSLPLHQFLPERRDGKPVSIADAVHLQFFLPDALGLIVKLLARGFQVFASLTGEGMQLGQLFAQLLAAALETVQRRLAACFQVGQLPADFDGVGADPIDLGLAPRRPIFDLLFLNREADALCLQLLLLAQERRNSSSSLALSAMSTWSRPAASLARWSS